MVFQMIQGHDPLGGLDYPTGLVPHTVLVNPNVKGKTKWLIKINPIINRWTGNCDLLDLSQLRTIILYFLPRGFKLDPPELN